VPEWEPVVLEEPALEARFYEPWQPKVGDRVRYLYQPECPGVYGLIVPVGHPREYDHQPGTVYEIHGYGVQDRANGHRFLVRLDSGNCISAAACELEPLA
jgi:hypothetical protein